MMKKTLFSALLAGCFMMTSVISAVAQQTEKDLKSDIKEKAIREARREAKRMGKEGWSVAPGSLPLDKLIENAWMKQYMVDEKGDSRFITSDGNAVAESKTAAEMQAIETAKLQLAGLIQTNMSSLINANIGNSQLSTKDAASVTEVVQSAKNMIAMELGYVNPFFKIYRNLKNDKIEVQVRLFYDVKQSLEIAKKVIRRELKDKLKVNEEQLDKMMGIDNVPKQQ